MQLSELKLTNFRNYAKFKINFNSKITIFIGPNGIGKTNLIESMYLLSTTTSYRTRENIKLIKWNQNFSKISAIFAGDELELRIICNNHTFKEVYLKKSKKKLNDLIGKIWAVLFSPEAISAVNGSPQEKRRYFNVLLSQKDNFYYENLVRLQKIIKQKNKLLYKINTNLAQICELDFWNEELCKVNQEIVAKRNELVKFLNSKISDFYQKISNSHQILKIKYFPKIKPDDFWEKIKYHTQEEIKHKLAIFGPHRDEIQYLLNNKNITGIASRGELRSVVMALKFAELEYAESKSAERPILLLDDIFSELDQSRRNKLKVLIGKYQTIITATELEGIDEKIKKNAQIINLGEINVAKD